MELEFKKLHDDSIIPNKPKQGDVGYDLYVHHVEENYCGEMKEIDENKIYKDSHYVIHTGVACSLPEGFWGLIKPRSGMSFKYGLDTLAGVIDNNYRGEICVIVNSSYNFVIDKGDRVAQMVLIPENVFDVKEVSELSETNRGDKKFGSSGR